MATHRSTPHRSLPPPTRAELQALLDREGSAWLQREGESWEAFVRRKAPPEPSFFKIADRAAYQLALAEALRIGEQRATRRALFLPIWIGNNEDEEPSSDVWRRHLLLLSEDPREGLLEVEREEGLPFWARVEVTITSGGFVVPSHAYAPDVPLERRIGPYAVCRSIARTVIDVALACAFGDATPAPTRSVPAFSTLAEPALDPDQLPPDVAETLTAVARGMQALAGNADGER